MAKLHIEEFYTDVARILLQLHLNFPRKSSVFVEDIAGEDKPDEYGVHSPRHMACFGAMLWLAEEGYLRYDDTIRQEAIDQAVLSHKGFTLLSRINTSPLLDIDREQQDLPSSIARERHTNAAIIERMVRTQSSSALAEFLEAVLLDT